MEGQFVQIVPNLFAHAVLFFGWVGVFEGLRHTNWRAPIFYPLRYAIVPKRCRENGHSERERFKMAIFPVSLGKNRISQQVEDWGSLISVPQALRVGWVSPS